MEPICCFQDPPTSSEGERITEAQVVVARLDHTSSLLFMQPGCINSRLLVQWRQGEIEGCDETSNTSIVVKRDGVTHRGATFGCHCVDHNVGVIRWRRKCCDEDGMWHAVAAQRHSLAVRRRIH